MSSKKIFALFNVNDDYMPVSLSASKSFFKTSGIDEHGIRFDTRIKPNFEDAHFLNVFLLSQEVGRVAYMRKPIITIGSEKMAHRLLIRPGIIQTSIQRCFCGGNSIC